MNNKLIIGIVIVITIVLVELISLILTNHFQMANISHVQPISTPNSPQHLSINLAGNLSVGQSP